MKAISTIVGRPRIRPTGMKRPIKAYPMIIMLRIEESSVAKSDDGPTKKSERPAKQAPIIIKALLSHVFGM